MALSQQDLELIEARAELIAERVTERVVKDVLAAHLASCPHGKQMETWKQRLIGVGVVAALIATGSSAGTALVLKVF